MGVRCVRVFIQSYKNGIPHSHNFYVAFAGFREMGFEIIPFSDYHTLATSRPEDIVVGYVGICLCSEKVGAYRKMDHGIIKDKSYYILIF